MINVQEATKTAYLDGTSKTITITFPNRNVTFTNSDIEIESMELKEAIETERTLSFKGCIASMLKFKVADIVTDLRGEYLEAKIQAGETEEIPLFKGYVDTQDNETHEDVITEFTCYDPLYKIGSRNMQNWVNSLSYPITVRNFRNSLFATLGITQESKTLVNDGLTISADLKRFVDAPSGTDFMRWICQLNGVYGQYGRDGQFKYRELKTLSEGLYPSEITYPSPTTYPSDENAGTTINSSDYVTLKYEPYTTDYITKVSIMDDNGVEHGYGTTGNTFVISDNPIAFCVNMTTAARMILSKVGSINHIPVVEMKCVGFPYLECGDTYLSYTRLFVCRTYILQRTLSGIQALFDSYSSDCDKDYPVPKVSQQNQINANKTEIKETQTSVTNVDNRVTGVDSRVTGVDNRVTQTNNRVSTVEGQVTTISGQVVNINGSVNNLNGQVTNLNSSVNNINGQVTNLNSSVTNINSAVTNINGQLNAVSARVGTLEATTVKAGQINANYINTQLSSSDKLVVHGREYRERAFSYAGTNYYILVAPRYY